MRNGRCLSSLMRHPFIVSRSLARYSDLHGPCSTRGALAVRKSLGSASPEPRSHDLRPRFDLRRLLEQFRVHVRPKGFFCSQLFCCGKLVKSSPISPRVSEHPRQPSTLRLISRRSQTVQREDARTFSSVLRARICWRRL